MEQDQRDGGEQQHPQQLVAVVGAENRVRGDAGRVVIGESGEQTRTDDRQQCAEGKPFAAGAIHGESAGVGWRRRGQTWERRNRRPSSAGVWARRSRHRVACSVGMAATISAAYGSGIARSTRSPTAMIGNADHVGGPARSGRGEHIGGRFGVEPVHQRGESGRVEVVHRRSGSVQLDGVPSFGSQVQIGPGHYILAGMSRQSSKAESAKHSTEPDLDADEFEPADGCSGQRDIGDARESLPHHIDDLGVEDVAHQQDLVVDQAFGDRSDGAVRWVDAAAYDDPGVLEFLDRRPRQQKVGCPSTSYRAGVRPDAARRVGRDRRRGRRHDRSHHRRAPPPLGRSRGSTTAIGDHVRLRDGPGAPRIPPATTRLRSRSGSAARVHLGPAGPNFPGSRQIATHSQITINCV